MADWVGAVCAWACGAVLVTSGALKLGTAAEFRKALVAFQLPRWTWRDDRFAQVFPWVEMLLGVGAILLPGPWQAIAVAAVLALFGGFLALVVRANRGPVPVSCNCFGGLGEERVGARTLIRNTALLALALAAVALHRSPSSVLADRLAEWTYPVPTVLALAVAAALVVWRGMSARRRAARLVRTLTVQDVDGNELPITEFQDPPTVLVFFAPGCSACHALVQEFRWWPNVLRDDYDLQPVFLGRPEAFAGQETFAPLAPHAWYDPELALAEALEITATPAGVLIDSEHPLGAGLMSGHRRIRELAVDEDLVAAARAGEAEA